MYRTDKITTEPTSWAALFDPNGPGAGNVSVYDAPIYIADAAVVLMTTKPELGIKNPYALDDKQFQAAVDLLKVQRPLIKEYWTDYLKQMDSFRNGNATIGTSWQLQQSLMEAEKPPVPVKVAGSRDRLDRLVRHLDDQLQDEARELRLPVAAAHHLARDQHPGRRVLRRGAGELEGVRAARRSRVTATSTTPPTRRTGARSGTGPRRSRPASTAGQTSSARASTTGSRPGPRSRADPSPLIA